MTDPWPNPPSANYSSPHRDDRFLLARLQLDQVRKATEQLVPERARSCRNAITMASVMIDEIRLRAHARPLDETAASNSGS